MIPLVFIRLYMHFPQILLKDKDVGNIHNSTSRIAYTFTLKKNNNLLTVNQDPFSKKENS